MKEAENKKPQGIIKKTVEHYYSLEAFLKDEGLGSRKLVPDTSIAKFFFKDGRIKETEYFYDGQPDYKTVYKYNRKKQLIKSIDFNPCNTPIRKAVNKYDSKGLCVESCTYSDMKSIDFTRVFSYDENALKISATVIQSDGSTDGKSYFEYGRDGKEMAYTYKDNAGNILEKFIDLIDEAGNTILSWVCKEGDTLEREFVFSYDLHNNLVEKEIICYSNGIVTEVSRCKNKYVYDKKNNWIKMVLKHDNDEFSKVVVREIQYF